VSKNAKKCYDFGMIARLTGTISYIDSRSVILDVGGIGYKVSVTDDTLHAMKKGSEISLWTHLAVREDALDLYGFIDKKDKDFFELLISISGIGPKGALNILSAVSSDTLVSAVRTGSTAHLVKVSGIGRKTAEKIVLELKDKLGGIESAEGREIAAGMSSYMDAIEALKALGYDADEAREALKKTDKNISDTSAKVKAALKMLG
jgi:Holliday junction DNA helicase RuvA